MRRMNTVTLVQLEQVAALFKLLTPQPGPSIHLWSSHFISYHYDIQCFRLQSSEQMLSESCYTKDENPFNHSIIQEVDLIKTL